MIDVITGSGCRQDRVAHHLTDREQHRISAALAQQGIRVEPTEDPFGVLHLWAKEPCTIRQEVAALREFAAYTDCRLAWHAAAS